MHKKLNKNPSMGIHALREQILIEAVPAAETRSLNHEPQNEEDSWPSRSWKGGFGCLFLIDQILKSAFVVACRGHVV
jgi:hypothetical protein